MKDRFAAGGPIPQGPIYQGYKPLQIGLPADGFHNGVLWAGLADDWRHIVNVRIIEGQFISHSWLGYLNNTSSN